MKLLRISNTDDTPDDCSDPLPLEQVTETNLNKNVLSPDADITSTTSPIKIYADMIQRYAVISLFDDACRPLSFWDELSDIKNWFNHNAKVHLISFHNSGTDALNSCLEYTKLILGRSTTNIVHLGYYGALYGPLLNYAAPWIHRLVNYNQEEYYCPNMPLMHNYTGMYDAAVAHYVKYLVPIDDDALPPLTKNDLDFIEEFKRHLKNKRNQGKPVTTLVLEALPGHAKSAPNIRLIRWISIFCREAGIIQIADECMTGVRCGGSVFMYSWLGYLPDLVAFSKAFNPVAAVGVPIVNLPIMQHVENLSPITTSLMDAHIRSVLLKKLNTYTPFFLDSIVAVGLALRQRIRSLARTGEAVRGAGLLIHCTVPLCFKITINGATSVHPLETHLDRLLPLLDFPLGLVDYIFRDD